VTAGLRLTLPCRTGDADFPRPALLKTLAQACTVPDSAERTSRTSLNAGGAASGMPEVERRESNRNSFSGHRVNLR
jgi:hypothetical protein